MPVGEIATGDVVFKAKMKQSVKKRVTTQQH